MNRIGYRYRFSRDVDLREARDTLVLGLLAAEGLFGRTRVRTAEKSAPDIHPDLVHVMIEWSDFVAAARKDANNVREMVLNETGQQLAKNRYGIETALPMNWGALVVEDNGPGMEPADLAELFTPGRTTKHGGSGFGLVIARNYVEIHDGELVVASSPGEGTTMTILLPRARPGGGNAQSASC